MLTIFTPTYNRAYILPRAYEALCTQTSKNFLWLIVDDGSTDETEKLVQAWIEEAIISISYYRQPNGGKMRAHNRAVEQCNTELFVCIDSDDYLVEDAVESILSLWNSIEEKKELAGIVAYRGKDPAHTMFGEAFPEISIATLQELYQKGFFGETTLIYRTDILSCYPFPIFEGEKFLPEAVVYDQIDRFYPLHILPKVLTICAYQSDGITRSIDRQRWNNPKGWLLYYQQRIEHEAVSVLRYKYIAHAICFCWRLKISPFKNIPAAKMEIFAGFPGAWLLRLKRKL